MGGLESGCLVCRRKVATLLPMQIRGSGVTGRDRRNEHVLAVASGAGRRKTPR
jgi:hypothetical protein